MPRRLTGVKDHLKSWPLIGRANFISTNGLSFALGSQPLATAALSVHCMPGKNARGSVRVFQFRLGSLFPRAHMGGLEQAIVFVFPLKHKFGTRAKIWRNTHMSGFQQNT